MTISAARATAPAPLDNRPCQRDPDRWFDPTDRVHALAGCLACPARSWCARQALRDRASWGMWAGIWIDDNLADVAHYLRGIAENAASPTPPPVENTQPANHTEAPHHRVPDIAPPAKSRVNALITARSSGHCEIMAPNCLLSQDGIGNRIPCRCGQEPRNPAAGYAVCRRCETLITQMPPRLSQQLGYTIDSPASAVAVPFYWRQSHWMRLDSAGGAAPCPSAQRTA